MKQFLFVASMFFFFQVSAQKHYTVIWAEAPKNPIPFEYTANHFGLKGKVKTTTETWERISNVYREFDNTGLLLIDNFKSLQYSFSSAKKFKYELSAGTMVKEEETYGNGKWTSIKQKFNTAGQIIESDVWYGRPRHLFIYTDKGLLAEKKSYEGYDQYTREKYEYNTVGQLVKDESYSKEGNLESRKTYQYQKKNNQLVINYLAEYFKNGNSEKISWVETYDAKGLLIKLTTSDSETLYSYQLDSTGNWTTKNGETKNLKTGITTTERGSRKIEYY